MKLDGYVLIKKYYHPNTLKFVYRNPDDIKVVHVDSEVVIAKFTGVIDDV